MKKHRPLYALAVLWGLIWVGIPLFAIAFWMFTGRMDLLVLPLCFGVITMLQRGADGISDFLDGGRK
jgi:hypothetical protein